MTVTVKIASAASPSLHVSSTSTEPVSTHRARKSKSVRASPTAPELHMLTVVLFTTRRFCS